MPRWSGWAKTSRSTTPPTAGKSCSETVEELGVDLAHVTPERLQAAISWAKNHLIPPDRYEPQAGSAVGTSSSGFIRPIRLGCWPTRRSISTICCCTSPRCSRESPELRRTLDARYRYIMVDEYQDTNLAQYSIVRALSVDHPNLAVTGDPDQSIYGWRGANLNNILEFEKDFPKVHVVRLEHNYRSTQRILRVADQLISHNRRRKPKSLFTENDEGSQVRLVKYLNNRVEAESIAARIAADVQAGRRRPRDFAIFYRTNALSRNLESALREYAIPYQMVNGLEFYQRKEIKDVLAYLQLLNNPRDRVALPRIINTPARGIGKSIDRSGSPNMPTHRGKSHARSGSRSRLDRRFDQAGGRGRGPIRRDRSTIWRSPDPGRSRRSSPPCSTKPAIARCSRNRTTQTIRSGWRTSKNC